jgi:hypothetical protein
VALDSGERRQQRAFGSNANLVTLLRTGAAQENAKREDPPGTIHFRRYDGVVKCDVIVTLRDREMVVQCPTANGRYDGLE